MSIQEKVGESVTVQMTVKFFTHKGTYAGGDLDD